MKKIIFIIILFYCICILSLTAFPASLPEGVREGNRLYDEKKYGEAVEKYSEAKAESPDSDIVNFNLGAAQYKKGSYGEAVDSFTKALSTDDHEIEAKAIYNIANAKYMLGNQKADADINSAVNLYRESLEYYKRAMDLDESAEDARYNHELVERELKALIEKQQNQQQQDQDRKDKEEQKQGQQDKDQAEKDAGNSRESQDRQESERDEQAGDRQESGEKSSGQRQDEDRSLAQEAPDQEGSPEEKTEKMSPEEARMLLESYSEEEAQENEAKHGRGYYPGVAKNW